MEDSVSFDLYPTDSIEETVDTINTVMPRAVSAPARKKPATVEEYVATYLPKVDYLKPYLTDHKNLRTAKTIPHKDGAALGETIQGQVWFAPLMLLTFVLYALAFRTHIKTFSKSLRTFFTVATNHDSHSGAATENSTSALFSFFLLASVGIALFCYLSKFTFHAFTPHSFIAETVKLTGMTLLYLLLKLGIHRTLCYTFFNREMYDAARLAYIVPFALMSTGVFLADILIAYSPIAIAAVYAGLVICAATYLLYLLKLATIFFNGATSLFYMILYLCTLEILPTIVLVLGLAE